MLAEGSLLVVIDNYDLVHIPHFLVSAGGYDLLELGLYNFDIVVVGLPHKLLHTGSPLYLFSGFFVERRLFPGFLGIVGERLFFWSHNWS